MLRLYLSLALLLSLSFSLLLLLFYKKSNYIFLSVLALLQTIPFILRFFLSGISDNFVLWAVNPDVNLASFYFYADFSLKILSITLFTLLLRPRPINLELSGQNHSLALPNCLSEIKKIKTYSISILLLSVFFSWLIAGPSFFAINRTELLSTINPFFKILMPSAWLSGCFWYITTAQQIRLSVLKCGWPQSFRAIANIKGILIILLHLVPLFLVSLFNARGQLLNCAILFALFLSPVLNIRTIISQQLKSLCTLKVRTNYAWLLIVIPLFLYLVKNSRDLVNNLAYSLLPESKSSSDLIEAASNLDFPKAFLLNPDASIIDSYSVLSEIGSISDPVASFFCSFLRVVPNTIRYYNTSCLPVIDQLNLYANPSYLDTYTGFNILLSIEILMIFGFIGFCLSSFLAGYLIARSNLYIQDSMYKPPNSYQYLIPIVIIQTSFLNADIGGLFQWLVFSATYSSLIVCAPKLRI